MKNHDIFKYAVSSSLFISIPLYFNKYLIFVNQYNGAFNTALLSWHSYQNVLSSGVLHCSSCQ
jgi:hypothetical protein